MDKMSDDNNISQELTSTKDPQSCYFRSHIWQVKELFSNCVQRKISTEKLIWLWIFFVQSF
jgi:hypothetical protein